MSTKPEHPIDTITDFAKEKTETSLDHLEVLLKKYELENIHTDFAEKIGLLVIAALGIITAVSWDQVLKLVAEHLFEGVSDTWSKILYAFFVTIITTIISIIVTKIFQKQRTNIFSKNIVEILRVLIKRGKK